jgi:hypothetical protein
VKPTRLFEFLLEFPDHQHLEREIALIVKWLWRNHRGRVRRARELPQDATNPKDGPQATGDDDRCS